MKVLITYDEQGTQEFNNVDNVGYEGDNCNVFCMTFEDRVKMIPMTGVVEIDVIKDAEDEVTVNG